MLPEVVVQDIGARAVEAEERNNKLADRGEPGTGEINYDYLFKVIENSDYNGWVGCEYKPQTTTEAGLRWMDPYR